MHKLAITAALVALSGHASATCLLNCQLTGQVVSPPQTVRAYFNNQDGQEIESETTRFQFHVTGADNDSCHSLFADKTINVQMNGGYPAVKAITQHQQLTIEYRKVSASSATDQGYETFSLPQP